MIMGYGTSTDTHARLLHIALCVLATVTITGASQYVWKTGRWRDCEHHACGAGGTRIRTVFCGKDNDNYYAETDESQCSHLPKPKSMEECFKVCSFHHDKIKWAESQFSECVLDPRYTECSVHRGIRHRNVTCVWRDDGRLEDDSVCSEFLPKPDVQERCQLKCPQDCVVSSFTPWQDCDTCIIANKTRRRSLIVPPANGGELCPSFTEMIPCDTCKDTYTYYIGPWDDCTRDNSFNSINKQHPLIGYQQRRIQCLNSYGSAMDSYKKCIDYLRSTTPELVARQTCIIPQDCVVSDYSPMISLNASCYKEDGSLQLGYMYKTRKILQIPLGAGKPCPTLIKYFPVRTSEKKDCPRTSWKLGSWGDCEAPSGGYPCTTGLQSRKTICVQKDEANKEKPVPEALCTERRPLSSRVCTAKCVLDCTLSQWTEWSECKVTDCELYLRRKRDNEGTGQRYRTREVLTEPQGRGRECLHLSETQICDPQPCYSWNMTVGACRLLNPNSFPPCGLGIAMRTLACVSKHGMRVGDSKCSELGERPNTRQDCDIPCPNDCVLSQWTHWSPCPNLCQEGRSRAAQRHRHRTILAQAGPGGKACPMSRYLTEVQHCPTTIECAIYVWQSMVWEPCRVNSPSSRCGPGTQVRDVDCYSSPVGHRVSDKRCTLSVKPKTSQKCEVPCPIDCEVTEYSDWSACDSDCLEAKLTVPIKKRYRYIIKNPKYGGKPCPNTLTETEQCTNLTFCESYYWDMELWSKCYLPLHKVPQCGQGLRARNVTCRSENGTVQPVDVCIKHIGLMPPVHMNCYKFCNEECVFGEWSQWSRCINGCNGNKYRTRKLIGDDDHPVIVKCRDRRLYPLDEQQSCLCGDPKPVPLGNWSECILESEDSSYKSQNLFGAYVADGDPTRETMKQPASVGINSICGPGKRYKVLACQNDRGEVESAQSCSLKPYKEEVCLVPCPVDCVMSDWSHWTDCSTSCGTGTQMRYRHIKQIPSYGGRKCPSLDNAGKETQTRICVTTCRQYKWREYAWTACWPDQPDLRPCGEGSQSRNIRCEVETANGYTNEAVDEIMCSMSIKPRDRQACYAPCVGECVVSEWTQWTRCQQPCTDPNQVQTRTRMVLRKPESEMGNSCPTLLEERFCIRGSNCIEYGWTMSDWTSCLVNNGISECGVGHRERFPVCRDQNDRLVEDMQCEQSVGESIEPLVESCEIDCDIDCLLSEWSPWSVCSRSCGVGNQLRTRDVVQQPLGNGRFCQTTREQSKPCFTQGCYSWKVSGWSQCTTKSGVCGFGTQTRNITCVANGGLPVNSSNCKPDLEIIILETERSCQMPCPGECIITEWSPWNECYIDCKDFDKIRYTRGVQSRSRAILAYSQLKNLKSCPDQLWESRPCEALRCYTFHWKKSDWSVRDTREVWCERSDHTNVTGGCPKLSRPETVLQCTPPCTLENSYCNDTNHCVCKDRFQAVHNRLGVLLRCRMSNLTNTQTTTSTITLPVDGATNVWMYAVIAAATVFVIFLAVACYTMSEFFTKGPRPRKKDQEKSIEGAECVELIESCNNVARSTDLNIVDAISADRTPPPCVRAHACMLASSDNESLSMELHETPPRARQHVINVNHDFVDALRGYPPNYKDLPFKQLDAPGGYPPNYKDLPFKQLGDPVSHVTANNIVQNDSNSRNIGRMSRLSPEHNLQNVTIIDGEMISPKPKASSTLRSEMLNGVRDIPKLDLESDCTMHSNGMHSECDSFISEDEHHDEQYMDGQNTEVQHVSEMCGQPDYVTEASCRDVVYLNREASDPELDDMNAIEKRKSSSSLKNMLQDYFDKTWLSSAQRSDTLEEERKERMPLMRKNNSSNQIRLNQRPSLSSTKSRSLDQKNENGYDTDLSLAENRTYSDESLDQTRSVRSAMSGRSRMSNLSISNGPSISIESSYAVTTDINQNKIHNAKSHKNSTKHPSSLRKRAPNIANFAFSSFETETSTAPSTSVSCESLSSPRSLPSETSEYSTADRRNQSEKSGRNIAIDSLKRSVTPQQTITEDADSGFGCEYKNGHAHGTPNNNKLLTPNMRANRKPAKSLPKSMSSQTVVVAQHDPRNGALLTPIHFQNGKSGKSESEI